MNVRRMCFAALMAALICAIAPVAVPVGPIPITLATFAVYLAGALLGAKDGTLAVALYLLLGAVGLPVFSRFFAHRRRDGRLSRRLSAVRGDDRVCLRPVGRSEVDDPAGDGCGHGGVLRARHGVVHGLFRREPRRRDGSVRGSVPAGGRAENRGRIGGRRRASRKDGRAAKDLRAARSSDEAKTPRAVDAARGV